MKRGIKELIDVLANECYVGDLITCEEYQRVKQLAQLLEDKGKNAGTRAGLEEIFEDSIPHPDFEGVSVVPEYNPSVLEEMAMHHRVKAEPAGFVTQEVSLPVYDMKDMAAMAEDPLFHKDVWKGIVKIRYEYYPNDVITHKELNWDGSITFLGICKKEDAPAPGDHIPVNDQSR